MENIVQYNIEDLANIEVPIEIIDKLDLKQLSSSVKDLVESLANAGDDMQNLKDQGWWEQKFKNLTGDNTRSMANAEKAVVDASKFNVALSCLLVLFSKALKRQQDEIIDQQTKIKKQQDDILILQGVTKDQADSIVRLLEADNFVKNLVEKAKKELLDSISELESQHKSLYDFVHTTVPNILGAIYKLDPKIKSLQESIVDGTFRLNHHDALIEKIQCDMKKSSLQFNDGLSRINHNLLATEERILSEITKNNSDFLSYQEIKGKLDNRNKIIMLMNFIITIIIIIYLFILK